VTPRQKWGLAGVASLALVPVLIAAGFGNWAQVGELLSVGALSAAVGGAYELARGRLRHLVARRAQDLEDHVRSLGFSPSASDARMNVRTDEHGRRRVWVEDPKMLRRDSYGFTLSVMVIPFLVVVLMDFGMVVLAVAVSTAMLLVAWTNRRATIKIEWVRKFGFVHQVTVHTLADVEAALATVVTVPATPERTAFPPDLDVRDLLARVKSSDDEDLIELLGALGERGSADVFAPLVRELRERFPMSPRVSGVADRAVARIRARHSIADVGALELGGTDDPTGRVALAQEAGALSPPERKT
jgi:hypothetical protein